MRVQLYHAREEHRYGKAILEGLGQKTQMLPQIRGDYLVVAFDEDTSKGWTSGFEHKNPSELMQGIMYTQHHLDQLNRMLDAYTETTLLITGRVLPNHEGIACTPYRGRGLVPVTLPYDHDDTGQSEPKATITYNRWDAHLRTLERCMGVRIMECDGQRHAAYRLLNVLNWWQRPPEEHKSHLGRFRPVSLVSRVAGRPGLIRRVAGEFQGVGIGKSLAVEELAKADGASLKDVLDWDEKAWTRVPGIGKGIAGSVVRQINE